MFIKYDTIQYDAVYHFTCVQKLPRWQPNLAHGTETKKQGVAQTGRNTTDPPCNVTVDVEL